MATILSERHEKRDSGVTSADDLFAWCQNGHYEDTKLFWRGLNATS